jgi:uncharacterized protein YeaO (DUF488 family)
VHCACGQKACNPFLTRDVENDRRQRIQLIKTKRVYEPANDNDGFRILVDRLWPRGLAKNKVKVDLWLKEIAPSKDLRKSFSHDPKRWEEFKKRYETELKMKPELIRIIKHEEDKGLVTLLYSAKDEEHNNAVALGTILKTTHTI